MNFNTITDARTFYHAKKHQMFFVPANDPQLIHTKIESDPSNIKKTVWNRDISAARNMIIKGNKINCANQSKL